jgi:hypothetical protein
MLIYRLADHFQKAKLDYAIVGGYAVSLHGAVRGTVDIDIILRLTKSDFKKAEELLLSMGFEARLPVRSEQLFEFRKEYIQNKNLIAWSFFNPKKSSEIIDIIITEDLRDLKSVTIPASGHRLKVLSIDSLIEMKKRSGRPQDIEDIRALKEILK